MALSDQQLLDSLSRVPFIDSMELALILGEPHTTVHRHLLILNGVKQPMERRSIDRFRAA